ncbi:MAG TPA: epoxide hydrolase [Acidimicrobiales bacterium]
MISSFEVRVAEPVLADLHERLDRWRRPNQVAGAGWGQGTELTYLEELVDHWRHGYDWRAEERSLNRFDQYLTEIEGQPIHFIHARSPHQGALPLVLSHGWPGSVVEFREVIGPLTDPVAHGGESADAFHVVAPSLPGYGFSGPTSQSGWHPRRIAGAFTRIMAELGYDRYGAQGGDWGSVISANIADIDAAHVAGLHLNFVAVGRPEGDTEPLSDAERQAMDDLRAWRRTGAGYQEIQGTRPQTLGYGLEDSPAGLAAWIIEKFRAWSDCGGDVERSFTKDQLLTNIMVYWVTATATSSTRLYYEMRQAGVSAMPRSFVGVPTGIAQYPAEITKVPRRWVEQRYHVTHWAEMERGGHFAAMEVPDLFVDDLRRFFRTVR